MQGIGGIATDLSFHDWSVLDMTKRSALVNLTQCVLVLAAVFCLRSTLLAACFNPNGCYDVPYGAYCDQQICSCTEVDPQLMICWDCGPYYEDLPPPYAWYAYAVLKQADHWEVGAETPTCDESVNCSTQTVERCFSYGDH